MKKTNSQLNSKINEHAQNVIDFFKEGLVIHQAYQDAPDKRNLTGEVAQFMAKLNAGIDEMDKVLELQYQLQSLNFPVLLKK